MIEQCCKFLVMGDINAWRRLNLSWCFGCGNGMKNLLSIIILYTESSLMTLSDLLFWMFFFAIKSCFNYVISISCLLYRLRIIIWQLKYTFCDGLGFNAIEVGDGVPPWLPSQKGGWRWGDSVPPWSPSQKGGWRGGRSPPWEIMGYHKFWCHFHPHDFLHIHWVFLLKFTNEHISQCSSTSTTSTFHVNYMSTINDVYKYLL